MRCFPFVSFAGHIIREAEEDNEMQQNGRKSRERRLDCSESQIRPGRLGARGGGGTVKAVYPISGGGLRGSNHMHCKQGLTLYSPKAIANIALALSAHIDNSKRGQSIY